MSYCAYEVFKRVFRTMLMEPLREEFPNVNNIEPNINEKLIESVVFEDCDCDNEVVAEIHTILREMTDEEVEQWKVYYKLTDRI